MATDVDVQYFSHLNGLTLGNNWGDLIRLLDKALVTGIDFTQITAASIDEQGDIHITLYSNHNAMLFQVVELSGFTPTSLNQKYRIKGVPNSTQLILKSALDIAERSITAIGEGKLASLGYDIIFRDANDVKRVYRAKNPTAQHPFIRVDESLANPEGTAIYNISYAKFAMVGLLESMEHIDDFLNPDVLQLPMYTANLGLNWSISGSGTSVARGVSRWYYASRGLGVGGNDTASPTSGARNFTLVGDSAAFYLMNPHDLTQDHKKIYGCGLFDSCQDDSIIPPWFLMTSMCVSRSASTSQQIYNLDGGVPLISSKERSCFFVPAYNPVNKLVANTKAYPITPDYRSGNSDLQLSSNWFSNISVPFYDEDKNLRGTLMHLLFNGGVGGFYALNTTTPRLAGESMYIQDSCYHPSNYKCGVSFYLGELT